MVTERYRAGDLLVDVDAARVELGGARRDLPPLSFALLATLLRAAPEVVRRNDLVAQVWNGAFVADETLSQRVRLLREALEDGAERSRYIESVRGWGYRIGVPVERLGGELEPLTVLAVLPFADLDGQDANGALCQGLAEEITSALSRVAGLAVIARTSCQAVSRLGLDVRQVGERLGAGSILEGSVRRSGTRVRVTVQLVRAADGGHLWSESYDRELGDVLELEDEIAEAVALHLRLDLAEGRLSRRATAVDPEAYQCYLQGRYHFSRGAVPEELARSMACYQRAIERAPGFAPAFDAIAELYWYLGFWGGMNPRDAFAQSTWHAVRALELDENLAETHALLGMLRKELDYNWPEVDREMSRALELDRSSPTVRLRYAVSSLMPRGCARQALAEVDELLTRDPLSLFVRSWSGTLAYLAREPDRTIEQGHEMIGLDPTYPLGHWVLGVGLELAGDLESARDSLRRSSELAGGSPFALGFLAYVTGRAGDRQEVRQILRGLEEASRSRFVSPMAIALAHAGLESWDEMFHWLERAIDVRDPIVVPLKTYPFLDPVRRDPRYAALLRRMNLD